MKRKKLSPKTALHQILKFSWIKTLLILAISIYIVIYGTAHSYQCRDLIPRDLLSDVVTGNMSECEKLNFVPHTFVKVGTILFFFGIVTIIYSITIIIINKFRKKN